MNSKFTQIDKRSTAIYNRSSRLGGGGEYTLHYTELYFLGSLIYLRSTKRTKINLLDIEMQIGEQHFLTTNIIVSLTQPSQSRYTAYMNSNFLTTKFKLIAPVPSRLIMSLSSPHFRSLQSIVILQNPLHIIFTAHFSFFFHTLFEPIRSAIYFHIDLLFSPLIIRHF